MQFHKDSTFCFKKRTGEDFMCVCACVHTRARARCGPKEVGVARRHISFRDKFVSAKVKQLLYDGFQV